VTTPQRAAQQRRQAARARKTTRDVRRPWKIGKARSKTKPHMVRWVVAGEVFTETFASFTLADGFRSELIQAINRAEEFDVATGLPIAKLQAQEQAKEADLSWLQFCTDYVAARWHEVAPKTRDSICDSLATATQVMVEARSDRPTPRDLRRAFLWAVLPANAEAEPPKEVHDSVMWLEEHSRPLKALADPQLVRKTIHQLGRTLADQPAAGDTYRRRRRGLNAALEYAVESGHLDDNPLKRIKTKRVAVDDRIDPRVVVTPTQARELLTSMSYVGSWHRARGRRLVGFFAVMYYAGMRPAEAVALRDTDCDLPDQGWGRLTLAETLPVTTKKWTDSGQRHDKRGLKQRDPNAVRIVPIPPGLVSILREHIKEFGVAADGRLFRNERDGILGSTTYSRAWEEARQFAFTPTQVQSPLAGRPYDLRHAALSTWLNAGISAAEVSRRAGNSVEVLLRRYAGCLDNQEEAVNRRIERALDEIGDREAG
jgi:integrase